MFENKRTYGTVPQRCLSRYTTTSLPCLGPLLLQTRCVHTHCVFDCEARSHVPRPRVFTLPVVAPGLILPRIIAYLVPGWFAFDKDMRFWLWERLCQRGRMDERRHNSRRIWFVVVDHRERRETVTAEGSNRYV